MVKARYTCGGHAAPGTFVCVGLGMVPRKAQTVAGIRMDGSTVFVYGPSDAGGLGYLERKLLHRISFDSKRA